MLTLGQPATVDQMLELAVQHLGAPSGPGGARPASTDSSMTAGQQGPPAGVQQVWRRRHTWTRRSTSAARALHVVRIT